MMTTLVSAPAQTTSPPYRQPDLPVEARVADLLGRMTLEEKAAQLDMYQGCDALLDKDQQQPDGEHAKPGAVFNAQKAGQSIGRLGCGSIHCLFPGPALYNQVQGWVIRSNRLGIPALFIEEGLHGYLGDNATVFPQSINLAATWNLDLARQTGAAIAAEARANGVNTLLAPMLDVTRDPRWGRIEEDFGEDPFLDGQVGLAYVQGMQGASPATDHNVIAVLKPFAAHGSPESGVNLSPAHVGERELRSIMLKSFEPSVREGHALGMMAAYNDIDGIPCISNPWLLDTVLRGEWGFNGFVVGDLGAIRRLEFEHHVASSSADAIIQAINAGVDMQFYDYDHETFQGAIIAGVKNGRISQAALSRAVSSVLRAKFMLGLFDHPFVDESLDARVRRSPDHLALSLTVARQSLCLLRNKKHLLPLSKDLSRIAVIGPNAKVPRFGDYTWAVETNFLNEGMLEQIKKLVSPKTGVLYSDGEDIDGAVALAKTADVVILGLGEWKGLSGECFDRSELGLPGRQEELLEAVSKTGVPVVLVLQNGRPLAIPWAAEFVPAILEAWYPGEFGGRAIAETLFGDNNPSGRLPISFPKNIGQLPVYYNHLSSKRYAYIDGDDVPQFVFGQGMSYTTFKYDHLTVTPPSTRGTNDVLVSFDLMNTGDREGDEVAQLYMRQTIASIVTPVKELKGFSRVHLKPGESKRVSLNLKLADLAIWNANREWKIEPGEYTVTVGGTSAYGISTTFTLSQP